MRWIKAIVSFSVLAACVPMDPQGGLPLVPAPSPRAPAGTQEGVEMCPPITPDAIADQMVILAKLHLARKLGIPEKEIALFEVRPAEWPDTSLGCPRAGMQYAQAITPGLQILLETLGMMYTYHTDLHDRVVLCEARPPDEIFNPP